jgi:hypothetical protein
MTAFGMDCLMLNGFSPLMLMYTNALQTGSECALAWVIA